MREIKFRGKLSHSGEWVIGNLIIARNNHPYIIPPDIFEPDGHHLIIDSDRPFWVIPETVGQFTGLTDKNRKEIFEGDLFKIGIENEIYEVKFEMGCFLAYYNGEQYGIVAELQMCFIEIIGNIHDNPELLKPKEND